VTCGVAMCNNIFDPRLSDLGWCSVFSKTFPSYREPERTRFCPLGPFDVLGRKVVSMDDENPYRSPAQSPSAEGDEIPSQARKLLTLVARVFSLKVWLISLGFLAISIVMSIIGGLADSRDIISEQTGDVIFVVAMVIYVPSYVIVIVGTFVGACKLALRIKRKWFG